MLLFLSKEYTFDIDHPFHYLVYSDMSWNSSTQHSVWLIQELIDTVVSIALLSMISASKQEPKRIAAIHFSSVTVIDPHSELIDPIYILLKYIAAMLTTFIGHYT